ncbi:MAG TPA: FAD-dependent oxidoreductase [Thermoplasmataceae archaeon]|nr:FAD-dependent oxidoreductase [Thermoplasmataceae archaeon]
MTSFHGEVKLLDKVIETPTKRSYLFERPVSFNFIPGQFVVIKLLNFPGSIRDSLRQFSISSTPLDNYIAISTQVIGRNSLFKESLDSLKPGDQVSLSGPNGSFTISRTSHTIVMIAGGVGVTPFRSMIRYLSSSPFEGKVALIHSSRTFEEILFYDEIEKIKHKVGWLETYRFLTREERQLPGFTLGRLDSVKLQAILASYEPDEVLVSGPPTFVESISTILENDLKLEPPKIKTEKFLGYK